MPQRADIASKPFPDLKRNGAKRRGASISGGIYGALLLAHAAITTCVAAEPMFHFSIAAQPLGSALIRYGDVTGKEALYEGGVVDGRFSGGVEGRATPEAALAQMLVGTGLTARFVAEETYVLEPIPERRSGQDRPDRRYYALVQQDVLETLCRIPHARPGQYRLVTVFWIAPDGTVQDFLKLGSVGQPETDHAINSALRRIHFREPPPAGFVQPIRLLFTPQSPGAKSDCDATEPHRRAQGGVR
ncbi:hypothetical protein RPMA_15245 [Tardiphaga alba]|uniref:Secretin/TonB short N-terminal domain-containing protein n=1 Tax=Tardiphaga alba TaxID=340268 RepID=A0ABX8A8G4_9BRAD|nr:secretin and TonB N-terminal domain-containing protein [Tardiphaga alba]QUS40034.1 hypothetical protein RPMA_15245 [Tardiphaga alba]